MRECHAGDHGETGLLDLIAALVYAKQGGWSSTALLQNILIFKALRIFR